MKKIDFVGHILGNIITHFYSMTYALSIHTAAKIRRGKIPTPTFFNKVISVKPQNSKTQSSTDHYTHITHTHPHSQLLHGH